MEASLARLVRLQRRLSYLLHKIIHSSSPVPSVYYSAASPASSTRSLNPPACLEKTFSALRTADDAGEPLLNKMAYFISHLTLREVVDYSFIPVVLWAVIVFLSVAFSSLPWKNIAPSSVCLVISFIAALSVPTCQYHLRRNDLLETSLDLRVSAVASAKGAKPSDIQMSDAPPRQRMRMSILQADIVRVGRKIDALSICKASPLSELEQVINILPRCKSLIEDSEKNTNCREYVQDAHLSMTIQDRKALNRWMEHFPETKQEALHLLMLER